MKESRLQKQIKKELEQTFGEAIVVYNIHGSQYQEAGIPDLLVCFKGYFVGLEIKTGSGYKASEIQKYQMKRIQNSGGIALVVESVEQALAVFTYLA